MVQKTPRGVHVERAQAGFLARPRQGLSHGLQAAKHRVESALFGSGGRVCGSAHYQFEKAQGLELLDPVQHLPSRIGAHAVSDRSRRCLVTHQPQDGAIPHRYGSLAFQRFHTSRCEAICARGVFWHRGSLRCHSSGNVHERPAHAPGLTKSFQTLPLLPQKRRPASPLTGGQAAPGD